MKYLNRVKDKRVLKTFKGKNIWYAGACGLMIIIGNRIGKLNSNPRQGYILWNGMNLSLLPPAMVK